MDFEENIAASSGRNHNAPKVLVHIQLAKGGWIEHTLGIHSTDHKESFTIGNPNK